MLYIDLNYIASLSAAYLFQTGNWLSISSLNLINFLHSSVRLQIQDER